MGGKGKRRHQNASNQSSGKRQKQSGGRSKEDGGGLMLHAYVNESITLIEVRCGSSTTLLDQY